MFHWTICGLYIYIKITKNNYSIMGGLYMNEVSLVQLIGLYLRVIELCVNVVCIVDFVELENIFFL